MLLSPSHARNRHQHRATSPRGFPGNRSNRARSQRLATANAVTFSKSNSLAAQFTATSTFRAFGVSRPHVGGIKSALLRFQYQETLPFGSGSAARKTTIASEITRLRARLWRSATVNAGKTAQVFVVKKRRRFKLHEVRQRFRLTPTEKRVIVFVAAAFVLGLVTKCYRDAHPSSNPVQTGKSRVLRSSSNAGQATTRTRKSSEKLDLSHSATKQEHQQK
jgi:hypothetical protein